MQRSARSAFFFFARLIWFPLATVLSRVLALRVISLQNSARSLWEGSGRSLGQITKFMVAQTLRSSLRATRGILPIRTRKLYRLITFLRHTNPTHASDLKKSVRCRNRSYGPPSENCMDEGQFLLTLCPPTGQRLRDIVLVICDRPVRQVRAWLKMAVSHQRWNFARTFA